jgi:hypothetical protein
VPQFTLLDEYSRRACLLPAMIATLPAAIAAAIWLPAVTLAPIVAILFSWFGLGVLLSELSRDVGKRREARLWATWGGSPTLRRLRLRTDCENPAARDRWRARVAALAPETPLLAAHDETADPVRADRLIEVCVARLRELTRDTSKFPIVFQENVSYGFRRNLWAMKPAAIFLTVLAIAAVMVAIASGHSLELSLVIVSIACSAVMLTWWLLRIRPSWVREAAERYADQLLWSCEQLDAPKTQAAPDIRRAGF